jgi:hypothetical protein
MNLTIDEAIAHADAQAYKFRGTDCGNEHAELARWLRELRTRRETGVAEENKTLRQIADIAHFGGLSNLSEADALTAIRRLTLMYRDNGRNIAAMTRGVLAALRASKAAGPNA